MLSIPPQGMNVLSNPPPSADVPDNPKNRQLIYITLNDQILSQIRARGGKGLSVTFGSNAGLQIGQHVHKFSGIVPEAQSSPFEIYRQKTSSSTPKLDLLGRVTHKIQVRRGLDSSSMERIKNRTEEAERERNSRKAVLLEKPPTSKRPTSVHSRNHSSSSRAFLSVYESSKPGVKGSGVRSLPSSPLLRPTAGSSTPKYLPIGGSPRIAPASSPRLPPSPPKSSSISLRVRLIHILALGSSTEQILQEKTRALRTELSTCLQDVARKIAPGSSSWELKDESYRDLRPREWKNYTSKERDMVEKKQHEVLARLPPPVEPETKVTSPLLDIPKKRMEGDVSDTSRLAATVPKHMDSLAKPHPATPSIPAKRSAEEDAMNPVRKVGGGIISAAKKKSTKVPPKESAPKTLPKEIVTPTPSRIPPPKKAKETPKVKSAEKVVDSDSDSDIPLQTQIKSTTKPRPPESKRGPKGLATSAIESEPKRQAPIVSPPISNTYRSRTSSTSSGNSYSPPKKRSPLATNEPVTASRRVKSPAAPSPTPSARKRARDDDIVPKGDKRQKLQTEKRTTSSPQTTKRETDARKIGQEYHDLANRFRKLYPEYQELHRRLQSLDTDRLAKEKGNVEKLFRMQEQLERWKTVLWKAAGETRRVANTTERTSGMVGVKG